MLLGIALIALEIFVKGYSNGRLLPFIILGTVISMVIWGVSLFTTITTWVFSKLLIGLGIIVILSIVACGMKLIKRKFV